MKKTFIMALALMMSSLGYAQTVDIQQLSYSVTYEKEHLFLQKDSGFNVVDYDIEWPNIVDFDKATPLKQTITQELTGTAMSSLDSLINAYNIIYGKPVTGPFKTIPDDNRFCYISSTAKIVGYKRGHWIAYYIENKVEPQKLSEFAPLSNSNVVVYDISRDEIFRPTELIRSAVVQRTEPQDFYDWLFSPLPDDFFNNMQTCEINGVWPEGTDLCFLITAATADQKMTYTSRLPFADYYYVLSREGKKVFTRDAKAKQPLTITAPITWQGDTIYNKVEKMPEFKGGQDGMRQYMSHLPSPGVKLDGPTKANTSFVIDKDGNIKDVSVISSVNPIIGRHAASIIKGMPKFTPGEQNGKKVCVRMYLPITYR